MGSEDAGRLGLSGTDDREVVVEWATAAERKPLGYEKR